MKKGRGIEEKVSENQSRLLRVLILLVPQALMASQVVFMFTVGILLKVKWWLLFNLSLKEACSLEVSLLLH